MKHILMLLACFFPVFGVDICDPFGVEPCGEYQYENCVWNPQASTWSQCLTTNCDQNNGFSVSIDFPNVGWNVQSYPMCYRGGLGRKPPAGMAYRCDTRRPTYTTFIVDTFPPMSGAWNCAYDIWTNPLPTATSGNDLEIMIWLARCQVLPAGTTYPSVTFGGYKWTPRGGTMNSWKYVAFIAQPNLRRVDSLNIDEFVKWCLDNGYAKPTSWVNSVQAGFEITWGSGRIRVNSFKVWWPSTSVNMKQTGELIQTIQPGYKTVILDGTRSDRNSLSTWFDIRGMVATKRHVACGIYLAAR